MSLLCCRFWVSGRVQGVFFRASTARVAQRLELTGYARNLADGRVEVLACGQPDNVAEMGAWLQHGPPASSVSELTSEEVSVERPARFTTG
ncbi:MAG: acylphosphatase [Gammaproteobacteria bacterium]|nr:acylphosphatase [Gammaproteobacteria bacterium]